MMDRQRNRLALAALTALTFTAAPGTSAELLDGLFGAPEATATEVSLYFAVQPSSQTVQPGSTVILDSRAGGGTLIPRYQWTLNGEMIPGATTRQLILQNVQPVDSGTYSVIVTDGSTIIESQRANLLVSAPLLPFADRMGKAGRITARTGVGRGNNENATGELGELLTTLLRPTHSVWLKWTAPEDGYMMLSTAGSGFDTTLTAFKQLELLGISLTGLLNLQLLPNAHDDESGDYHTSMIQFNVRKGDDYLFRVDGDDGQTGNIVLSWVFTGGTSMPNIVVPPLHQSVKLGQTTSLSIGLQSVLPVALQWFKDGEPISGATRSRLDLLNIQPDDLGLYMCRLTSAAGVFYSPDAEVQINSQGAKALAKNKRSQALASGLGDSSEGTFSAMSARKIRALSDISGAAGYSGTQMFKTYPGKDADEPNHCGVLGGASYWLSYVPPASGAATMDTIGSSFDTIVAVYRDDGLGKGYDSLIPVACDDNSGSDQADSRLSFNAVANAQYYVVVDGVNGQTGTAYLNYALNTAPTVSTVSNFSIQEDSAAATKSFSVSDKETAAGSLGVVFSCSNSQLFPARSIYLSGSGSASRSITLKPAANQSGSAVITLYVQDANGGQTTTKFTVTVTAIGDAPVAGADSATCAANNQVALYIPNLLKNDSDPDGQSISFYRQSTQSAVGGQITRSGSYLYYRPPANFTGADSFTYTIADSTGLYGTGKVTVNVGQ